MYNIQNVTMQHCVYQHQFLPSLSFNYQLETMDILDETQIRSSCDKESLLEVLMIAMFCNLLVNGKIQEMKMYT